MILKEESKKTEAQVRGHFAFLHLIRILFCIALSLPRVPFFTSAVQYEAPDKMPAKRSVC